MKEVYHYEDNERIFEGYYSIYSDSLSLDIDINNDSIDYLREDEYYSNGNPKKYISLSFHDKRSNRDTASFTIQEYDSLGNIIVHTEFSKERDYLEENPLPQTSRYIKYIILEDKIQGSMDTLRIEEESGLFNPAGL